MATTFNLSTPQSGIPISGSVGPSSTPLYTANNIVQTPSFNNQSIGGTITVPKVLGAATTTGGSAAPAAAATSPAAASTAQGVSDFNALKGTTLGSIDSAISGGASGFNSSILDYLDSRKTQQNAINTSRTQNELSREQGAQSITDMVGNGIKSGGVILANDNAGSSSAGEALARAYGLIGRQQMSSVGNQFAQGEAKINSDQDALTAADTTQLRHTQEGKTNTINSIVNDATTKLAALNQSAAYASIPDRIDIEKQIATIKQQALSALSAYDSELSQGISSQAPATSDQTRASAEALRTAGTAPESSFDYTTDVPAQLQGSGQFASSLPIFTSKKQNNT